MANSDNMNSDSSPVRPLAREAQSLRERSDLFEQVQDATIIALTNLREKQRSLKYIQGKNYSAEATQQYIERLSGLHREIDTLIDNIPLLEAEALSELKAKSSRARTQMQSMSTSIQDETPESDRPSKTTLKKALREVLLNLQIIVNDIDTELEALERSDPTVADCHETITSLLAALEEEKQKKCTNDLGQSRSSNLTGQTNLLALQIHRFQRLMTEPRLQPRIKTFETISRQIEDTISALDIEANNAVDFANSSTYVITKQLCQLEFNRKLAFIPLPIGWLVNRYHDITRLKSVQGRVLAGLGFTLLLSGSTFIAFMVVLTSVSAFSSSSIDSQKDEFIENYGDFLDQQEKVDAKIFKLQATQSIIEELEEKLEDSGEEATQAEQEERDNPSDTEDTDIASLSEGSERSRTDNQRNISETLETEQTVLVTAEEELEKMLIEEADLVTKLSEQLDSIRALENGTDSNGNPLPEPSSSSSNSLPKVFQNALNETANFVSGQKLLDHSRRILLAAFSGAIGSMMSILIRLDQIDRENIRNPFLLGALKPLIGAIFGILVFAILSTQVVDILPSSFYLSEKVERRDPDGSATEGNTETIRISRDPLGKLDPQELYKIFLVAFLAGFSERLASDTLKSVGSQGSLL